jgi:hypothetical protein
MLNLNGETLMPAEQTVDQAKGLIDVLLALLDWPFLLFVFLLLFVLIFKKKVMKLFERGDIQIGWGEGRHIKLKELSDGIDEEIDPIKDEIQELREQLDKLAAKSPRGPTVPSAQQQLDEKRRRAAENKILEGLQNTKYRWRSVRRLATISGIPESDALDILRANPEVVLGVDKSKRQIARLKDR